MLSAAELLGLEAVDEGAAGEDTQVDQRTIACEGCETRFAPGVTRSWKCPGCGVPARYGTHPGTCPRCGGDTVFHRHGYDLVGDNCDCQLTPAERAKKAAALAARDELEAQERRTCTAVDQDSRQARTCWDGRNQSCKLPTNDLPYDFCSACPRFRRVGGKPTPSAKRAQRPWPLENVGGHDA